MAWNKKVQQLDRALYLQIETNREDMNVGSKFKEDVHVARPIGGELVPTGIERCMDKCLKRGRGSLCN